MPSGSIVLDQLASLGIRYRNTTGEQKTTCPQCSHLRRKKSDRCLSLRIDHDGFAAHCWHCGWTAGGSESDRRAVRKPAQNQHGDFGAHGRRVRYGVLP